MISNPTTEKLSVDLLVIGWGKGGKTLAATYAARGRRVAIVEQSDQMYGGTCINIGCVPTKALVHSAQERRSEDDIQATFRSAVAARDTLIDKLRAVNYQMLADKDTVTVINGHARFVGPHEVQISGSAADETLRVQAETIVIGTGAVTVMPPIPGLDGPRVHTSTSIQHIDPFPKRLAIIGSGFIALEFASMFRGFGAEVTVIGAMPRLLPGDDEDIAAAVTEVLEGDGIRFVHGATVNRVDDDGQEATVRWSDADGNEGSATADAVLVSVGRRPATDDLGLEAAGIETTDRGAIVVDDHLRTNVPGVYAVGDVNGGPQHTYISLDDFRIVLDDLLGNGTRVRSDRVGVPSTTFMTPPFSAVGMSEDQAIRAGYTVKTAMKSVAAVKAMPRPKTVQDARGVIKFVVDAETDQILGARLFHVDSQEVINLVALAMRAGITASTLRDGIWTHPSSTEALNEVLGELK
ncbi:FAD-dependent oxidoreductase [Devriesea agamarum]|uniref:FAD-dependent oxidoreductase n=1 Tax=Devriesea agamarum TaxID=472569 RepID=UPI00071C7635|nr:FAD-dependent oxidoreductase [Devriesea agamarum]